MIGRSSKKKKLQSPYSSMRPAEPVRMAVSAGGDGREMAAEPQHVVLIHYHEIGLKGHNRSYFEKLLRANIGRRLALLDAGWIRVRRISGRLLIELAGAEQAVQAAKLAADVPGVVRVSVGLRLPQNMELIEQTALTMMAECEPYRSFKVQARRANTDFPINSMDLNRYLGGWLDDRLSDKHVQMQQPDVCLHLEMIEGVAFLYTQTLKGVGGLPVGSAGTVVSLLSAGIDSPVASWRLLRRGAEVIGLHFSGRPETTDTSEYLVAQIAGRLEPFGGLKKLAVVPFGAFQRQIAASVPQGLRVVLYRRLMFLTAEALAVQEGAKALVTGESLGQVASQTLDNIRAVDDVVRLPVLRPLIGSDKLEIIAEAERLGSFAVSCQSHDDCCTLFMPRNPETHANLEEVRRVWENLPVADWLAAIMEQMEYPRLPRAKTGPAAPQPGITKLADAHLDGELLS
ncbi:MAG: tRNA 4-thiouridine(8) synthase ThiI [Actinomycetia bacterium]|nr:tRNA 4-thiouridine(8) synthase ThiI [Actinomycetes bacterium]